MRAWVRALPARSLNIKRIEWNQTLLAFQWATIHACALTSARTQASPNPRYGQDVDKNKTGPNVSD
jgi:hypothetical protein